MEQPVGLSWPMLPFSRKGWTKPARSRAPSPLPFNCHPRPGRRKGRVRSRSPPPEPGSPGPFQSRSAPVIQDEPADSLKPFRSEPLNSTLDLSFNLGSVEHGIAAVSQALGASSSQGRKLTTWKKKGRKPETAQERLAEAGRNCRCSQGPDGKGCHNLIGAKALASLRQAYWSLTCEERGHMMRSLHSQAAGPWITEPGTLTKKQKLVKWKLCGHKVCFSVFCWLLGHSQRTLLDMLAGVPDGRSYRQQTHGGEKSEAVDFWFYELYLSAAEPMPKEPTLTQKAGLYTDSEVTFDGCPWLQVRDRLNPEEVEDPDPLDLAEWSPDQAASEVLQRLTVASTGTVAGLKRRWLPHQRLHDLYWLFQGSWQLIHQDGSQHRHGGAPVVPGVLAVPEVPEVKGVPGMPGAVPPCPSFTVFWRRWTKVWSQYLRMRKSSQHAQCQTCFQLQQDMHEKGATWGSRMQAAQALRQHYQHQYLDRCIYWSTRYASRAGLDVLCIIIDSPDKTHFTWPHWPWHRTPKCLEELHRPKMVATGVIAHGYFVGLEISHENQAGYFLPQVLFQ